MAVYDEGFAPTVGAPRLSSLVNLAGATLSLALIIGVSFWGYKLIMRDVTGIPVVRAMEGDMRVLPDNPGGEVALHTGLSVNEVAAVGEAGGPEDVLVLAPVGAGLAQEDLEAQPTPDPVIVALEDIVAPTAPSESNELVSLVDQLAAGAVSPDTQTTTSGIDPTVPGVATSLRPVIRPAALRIAPASVATTSNDEVAVTTQTFPAGTNLVQLGAFTSPALAAAEWDRLQAQFGQLINGRDRVIQVSSQSSGTWYRLRAAGFADRADARRLCAAMQAEGAECIAVVTN